MSRFKSEQGLEIGNQDLHNGNTSVPSPGLARCCDVPAINISSALRQIQAREGRYWMFFSTQDLGGLVFAME